MLVMREQHEVDRHERVRRHAGALARFPVHPQCAGLVVGQQVVVGLDMATTDARINPRESSVPPAVSGLRRKHGDSLLRRCAVPPTIWPSS